MTEMLVTGWCGVSSLVHTRTLVTLLFGLVLLSACGDQRPKILGDLRLGDSQAIVAEVISGDSSFAGGDPATGVVFYNAGILGPLPAILFFSDSASGESLIGAKVIGGTYDKEGEQLTVGVRGATAMLSAHFEDIYGDPESIPEDLDKLANPLLTGEVDEITIFQWKPEGLKVSLVLGAASPGSIEVAVLIVAT